MGHSERVEHLVDGEVLMNDENPWCYVAKRKTCGCVVAAAVDVPTHREETAKFVAECVRDGYDVERMRVVEVRKVFGCDHKHPEQLELK